MKKSAYTHKLILKKIPILQPALSVLLLLALMCAAGCGVFNRRIPRVGPPPANLNVAELVQTGRQVYQDQCAKCHGLDGLGIPGFYYALAGDPIVTAQDAGEMLEVILYGTVKPASYFSYRNQMKSFAYLTDDEVAAVVTYVRHSWGNQASAVAPEQVLKVRGGD